MYIGSDFYPEHWPTDRWEEYASLMEKAEFNIVRMAEFAWVFMEPEEGRFEFGWLDSILEILHRHGISAILGTPTAVMPAWVKEKYPDCLAGYRDGGHDTWGVRKNNCFSSAAYRMLSERITRAMAEHFAHNPAVIGWQTDNELDGPYCVCPSCRIEFQTWLKQKYTTLDELNRCWGTHFWGQIYTDWQQIEVMHNQGGDNPSLCLDWYRFNTRQQVRFQREQIDILRATCPGQFITHNLMGFNNVSSCVELAQDLDFASYDNYVIGGNPGLNDYATAGLDLIRGCKNKNFWIMETNAGPAGWGEFGRTPRPGEMRKVFYQHVGHGADAQLFFRWRTCTAGREQYWHGLLGHDGRPLRRYNEAAHIAEEAHQLGALLEGTEPKPEVALIFDYESWWATRIQGSFAGNDYIKHMLRFHHIATLAGVSLDLIPKTADFSRYKALIAPQLYVLPDDVAERLNDFVEAGGVLIADIRTGVKDEFNLCHERTLPGLLSKSLGIEIQEYEAIQRDPYPLKAHAGFEGEHEAGLYADWITPTTAETLFSYTPWHVESYAAVTRNRFGKGTGYYIGTVPADDGLYKQVFADAMRVADVTPPLVPPAGVEVCERRKEGLRLLLVINHEENPVEVAIPAGGTNALTDEPAPASVTLDRFEVVVLKYPA